MFQAQRIGLPTGDQPALMENQQVIAGLHFVEQMGGPEHADALLAAQVANVLVERQATGRVESGAGFIE